MSAAVRLSTRLRNQKIFTQTLVVWAESESIIAYRFHPCDPVLASRLGGNLPQELNAFLSGIRSESLL